MAAMHPVEVTDDDHPRRRELRLGERHQAVAGQDEHWAFSEGGTLGAPITRDPDFVNPRDPASTDDDLLSWRGSRSRIKEASWYAKIIGSRHPVSQVS